MYIRCDANAKKATNRWSSAQVIMSQKGSARMFQIMAVDRRGRQKRCPFHVSIYYVEEPSYPSGDMDSGDELENPFLPNNFQSVGPDGEPYMSSSDGAKYAPDPTYLVGWGTGDQKAGYSPNRFSDGAEPTGLLWDESVWSWDMTRLGPGMFDPNWYDDEEDLKDRDKENKRIEARSLWVHVYAEADEDVYFIGRIYKLEPGSS